MVHNVNTVEKSNHVGYNMTMEKILSHFSAANFWDIPYLYAVSGNQVEDAIEKGKQHFTFTSSEEICYRKDFISHLCKLPLPSGAIVSRDGVRVASPEMVFLQLANHLSIHRLILLGLQLCSRAPGRSSEGITTKQRLKNFLGKTRGHRGHRKAVRAVKYIENGSASIMESLAFMILSLPNALGGFGLGTPTFNYEIKLKDEGEERLRQNRCFVDLYYKEAKLAVEYDSFAFHSSPADQGKDVLRSIILKKQGIEVLSLSTIQLYDEKACKDFVHNLADRIGKKVQIRTGEFEPMHTELRKLLPNK